MGAYQLHKHELGIGIVLLFILLSLRINKGVDNWRKAEGKAGADQYKNVHTEEMLKKWVTSQYCKADKIILCPVAPSASLCYTAFDPPLRFVLGLSASEKENTTENCSIRDLIDHTQWSDKATIKDLKKDELLTYFIAHVLDQVRIKSSEYFRADDGNILEFEQSRLIESNLASILHLFASPIEVSKEGKTVSTKATEYGLTENVWTREEVVVIMHEAVLWHAHHKRHGSSSAGAALRFSRQQPSFLFKFLPLVKEQIQNLEIDNTMESKYQKLYPFPKLGSPTVSLGLDSESESCLWSHYEENTLITEDCALALETAPLKIRDLDWEGNFTLLLVYIYNYFSGAFAMWILSRASSRSKHENRKGDGRASVAAQEEEMEALTISNRSLKALSNRSLKAASTRSLMPTANADADDVVERKSDQIRRAKWICLAYLGLTAVIALVSSAASETIQFSDFWDGILFVVVAFLCLHPISLGVLKQSTVVVEDKRIPLLDPKQNRHYKKFASIEFDEFDAC